MIEQIFALLGTSPVLSISLIFALVGFLAYVFRNVIEDMIKAYIKKKYELYDEAEIKVAFEKSAKDNSMYAKASEKLTPSIENRVLKHLKEGK